MVFKRQVEGEITHAENAKIAIYSCPVDIMQTETKGEKIIWFYYQVNHLSYSGTVLIKSADELMNFSRGEENILELQIKSIADTGAKVIVAGAKFGDMALHYIHKYNMMAVRLNSKFDLRRLSKTVSFAVCKYVSVAIIFSFLGKCYCIAQTYSTHCPRAGILWPSLCRRIGRHSHRGFQTEKQGIQDSHYCH